MRVDVHKEITSQLRYHHRDALAGGEKIIAKAILLFLVDERIGHLRSSGTKRSFVPEIR
jgi:hypothetical protein